VSSSRRGILALAAWFALLLPQCVASSPNDQAAVRFELVLRGPETAPLRGQLTLRPVDGKGESVVVGLTSKSVVVPLAAATTWEARAEIAGYWCRPVKVTVGQPATLAAVAIPTWPLGEISGRVAPPFSKALTVVTLAPRRSVPPDDVLKGAMNCPVDARGRWSCELPASTFDLVVTEQERDLAPSYLRGVAVPPGKSFDVGILQFSRGASLAGWVEVDQGRIIAEQCVARLTTIAEGDGPSMPPLEIKVAADGFFQVTEVPAGRYLLEIEQPGYQSVHVSPVNVSSTLSARYYERPFILRVRDPQLGERNR